METDMLGNFPKTWYCLPTCLRPGGSYPSAPCSDANAKHFFCSITRRDHFDLRPCHLEMAGSNVKSDHLNLSLHWRFWSYESEGEVCSLNLKHRNWRHEQNIEISLNSGLILAWFSVSGIVFTHLYFYRTGSAREQFQSFNGPLCGTYEGKFSFSRRALRKGKWLAGRKYSSPDSADTLLRCVCCTHLFGGSKPSTPAVCAISSILSCSL